MMFDYLKNHLTENMSQTFQQNRPDIDTKTRIAPLREIQLFNFIQFIILK